MRRHIINLKKIVEIAAILTYYLLLGIGLIYILTLFPVLGMMALVSLVVFIIVLIIFLSIYAASQGKKVKFIVCSLVGLLCVAVIFGFVYFNNHYEPSLVLVSSSAGGYIKFSILSEEKNLLNCIYRILDITLWQQILYSLLIVVWLVICIFVPVEKLTTTKDSENTGEV